jgi:hypothetical protein
MCKEGAGTVPWWARWGPRWGGASGPDRQRGGRVTLNGHACWLMSPLLQTRAIIEAGGTPGVTSGDCGAQRGSW